MKCNEVRLTEICKSCDVNNKDADCPTVCNDGSTINYGIPHSIFNLAPCKNHIGEKVICVEENVNCSDKIKVGEVLTVIDQTNEQYGYLRFDKFKDFPHRWFGPDNFKKLKATYNGIEYTLYCGSPK